MTAAAPETATSSKPEAIRFGLIYSDVPAALADISMLRRGNEQSGNWSLPQIACHLLSVMNRFKEPAPAGATQSLEQAARLQKFHDTIAKPGGSGAFPAGPESTPPASCEDVEIDKLIAALDRFQHFPGDKVDLGPFGATDIELVRRLHLLHAAHHLSFLAPKNAKRNLHFDDFPAAIVEIQRLRQGYVQCRRWNLEQMCFHVGCPIPIPLKAFSSSPTPVVNPGLIARFQFYADHDAPMPGVSAPAGTEPPELPLPNTVDDLIERLKAADAFTAEFVDLGPRGPMKTSIYKPFLRGHCAHHLSFLLPSPR